MTANPKPVRRIGAVVLAACACTGAVVVVGLGVAWRERTVIGARVVADYLRRQGVPATLHLSRLDRGGVEGALVLGPADHPTLTAPHFRVDFAPNTGLQTPQVRRVMLNGAHLVIGYDGHRLDLGALQPLVDTARRAPKGRGAAPDILLSDTRIDLRTPYGLVRADADARLTAGRLQQADVRLSPTELTTPERGVEGLAGQAHVQAAGARRLAVRGAFAAVRVRTGAAELKSVSLAIHGDAPFDQAARVPWAGPLQLHIQGAARNVAARSVQTRDVRLQADAAGLLSAPSDRPAFSGRLQARGQAAEIDGDSGALKGADIQLTAPQLSYGGGDLSTTYRLIVKSDGGHARFADARLTAADLRAASDGRLAFAGGRPSLTTRVNLGAGLALDPVDARRLAARLAPGAFAADLRPALAQAFQRATLEAAAVQVSGVGDRWRMQLPAPLALASASGAQLALRSAGLLADTRARTLSGAATVSLAGGGLPQAQFSATRIALAPGKVHATLNAKAAGSTGPLQGAQAQVAGRLDVQGRAVRLALSDCARLAMQGWRDDAGKPLAGPASAQVCPATALPFFTLTPAGWTANGRIVDLDAKLTAASADVHAAALDLHAAGHGRALAGELRLSQVDLSDTAAPRRFGDLRLDGPLRLTGQTIAGQLAVALTHSGTQIGRLTLTHDLTQGAGGLRLETGPLTLAPSGLQPAAVLPGLAALGQDVSGQVTVSAHADWRGQTLSNGAVVQVDGVQLKTAAGLVSDVRTELHLTSLAPLLSAPGQTLTAQRLAAVVPLTDISARYALQPDALDLSSAKANLANGRVSLDPMVIGLRPGAVLAGTLRADGVELSPILDALNLSRSVSIQARLAGQLPFRFGSEGLRISDGRLAAMGPGRLTLKREALTGAVSAGGATAASPVQDLAYQALEDLAFTELDASVASRPKGRLGVVFHIRGRHDPPVARVARLGLFDLLRGRAFNKPIPLPKGTEVNLTLDSSLNLDDLLGVYLDRRAGGSAGVQP